ncbi:hypothetical protein GCM10010170_046170 [Dactylosporangium salmoneum]|uniref:C-type cytochrome biogenesis protein CcmI n=2 Tax=Dactylosporangium salmoneum TaxID=53361 RepID=A0ABP5TJS1_9ACTN
MLAAAAIAAVYVLLIAHHLRRAAIDSGPARQLNRAERAAAARLLTGDLDRAAYRAAMEALAAQESTARPLLAPTMD